MGTLGRLRLSEVGWGGAWCSGLGLPVMISIGTRSFPEGKRWWFEALSWLSLAPVLARTLPLAS